MIRRVAGQYLARYKATVEVFDQRRGFVTSPFARTSISIFGGILTDRGPEPSAHVCLADFIRENEPAIITEWIDSARTRSPASHGMSKLALQDHIVDILKCFADDLDSTQTAAEQFDKSRGLGDHEGPFRQSAAEIHAALRLADGFDIDQMVSEYRALRASVVKQWSAHATLLDTDIEDLKRAIMPHPG